MLLTVSRLLEVTYSALGKGAMLTCSEVAVALAVSTQFVRDEITAGRLHAYRLGVRAIRVRKSDLATYIEKCEASRQKPDRNLDSR